MEVQEEINVMWRELKIILTSYNIKYDTSSLPKQDHIYTRVYIYTQLYVYSYI